jgi:hypothetical protein
VFSFPNAQESGRLFKGFGAEPLELQQLAAITKRAVLIAPGNNVFGQRWSQSSGGGRTELIF